MMLDEGLTSSGGTGLCVRAGGAGVGRWACGWGLFGVWRGELCRFRDE